MHTEIAAARVDDVELTLVRPRIGRHQGLQYISDLPARSRGIASTAYMGLTNAWVASTATSPSRWMQTAPTAKKRDATAAPNAPVSGSRAMIEKVILLYQSLKLRRLSLLRMV